MNSFFFFFLGGGGGGYLNATLGALCSCMQLFNVFVGGLFL